MKKKAEAFTGPQLYYWEHVLGRGKRMFQNDQEAIETLRKEVLGLVMIYVEQKDDRMRTVWYYKDEKGE